MIRNDQTYFSVKSDEKIIVCPDPNIKPTGLMYQRNEEQIRDLSNLTDEAAESLFCKLINVLRAKTDPDESDLVEKFASRINNL